MSQVVSQSQMKEILAPKLGRVRNIAPPALRTYAGVVYQSKAEAKYAFELDALKASGRIKDWKRQVAVRINVNGVKICKLVVDFEVWPITGNPWLIEIKGHETEVYKLKRKLLRACHPGLDYRVIKV